MSGRTPVAILGATGLVGRRLVRMLHTHPWFEAAELLASDQSAGSRYGERVEEDAGLPEDAPALRLTLGRVGDAVASPIVLSALPASAAAIEEPRLASEGRCISSNASVHRARTDVPLIVPEVNPGAIALLDRQPWSDSGGALVTNPNCVVAGLAPVLAAIDRVWGVEGGAVVTLQALSGAGLSGPTALAALGNVVPHIVGEEEKIPAELSRILGRPVPLAVTVNRVPVVDGHLAHLFLRLGSPVSAGAVAEAIASFRAPGSLPRLPSLPERTLRVVAASDRPQPRLDVDAGEGMTITVGRIRAVDGFDVALTVLVHNLVRGAAGACLANAELIAATRADSDASREADVAAGR